MFLYNLRLALENFKRAKLLYSLVAFTLALGIGLLSANIALINSMMSDPIPHKSDRLFHVSMNTWPQSDPHEEPFYILRYRDASKILEAESAKNAAVFFGSGGYIRDAESSSLDRTNVSIRATSHGFFELADTPFLYGNAFAADNGFEVVLGDNANNRIFGGGNSVGRSIELNGKHYKVVGVLKPWHLRPRFYHITENQAFFTTDDIFVPLETALDENLPIHGRSSSTDTWYKASDTRDRNVYYLHACENEQQHSFKVRTNDICQSLNWHAHTWYNEGLDSSTNNTHKGLMDFSAVDLPLEDADFYLCGPVGFMKYAKQSLVDLGVEPNRVHYEVFGPHDNF